ncbi:MAG TPA: tetraacyldisaccharide 4'-kinase [Rhizomicrobium sp.]|jgi:tetraacyldisaccharide 4'-kinase|nr:tetraacyldisaccharide 4'-kinase [Rhizomicrobium sp.]
MRAPEFWNRGGAAATLLAPLGALHGLSVAWKAQHAKPYRAQAKVICVGNLTAGGSGKTPVALAIAGILRAKGQKVFFLTRGYGGSEAGPAEVKPGDRAEQMGDEALLLSQAAPTIVARDRALGAALAGARGADIIVMDDGHQNFAVAKDLSLVVVDGESGFGNGRMIPAGPLRESVRQGLKRADAVIMMGRGNPDLEGYQGALLNARLVPEGDFLQGKRVFAFAGIGRPEKFVATLKAAGALVMATQFFADHHPFQPGEIAALRARAGGVQLVTTEKDFVRLKERDRAGMAVLKVQARFDDPEVLDALLDRIA